MLTVRALYLTVFCSLFLYATATTSIYTYCHTLSPHAALPISIFHMMNHATFKASLFMAAGISDHETGTRDIRRLSGLGRIMPTTAILATVAAAADRKSTRLNSSH